MKWTHAGLLMSLLVLAIGMMGCGQLQIDVAAVSPEQATATAVGTDRDKPNQPTTSTPTAETVTEEPAASAGDMLDVPSETGDDEYNRLIALLNARDFVTLQGMLADPFTIGYWRSEGVSYTPAEAVAALGNMLSAEPDLTYTTDRANFPELDGRSPSAVWAPDVAVDEYVYVIGWGEMYNGQAILGVRYEDDGALTWVNMLYAAQGFDRAGLEPQPYPEPGARLMAWDTILDPQVYTSVTWSTYERVMRNPENGMQWVMTFDYPTDWNIAEQWSTESYLIVQNVLEPTMDHGIPQEPIAKIDMMLFLGGAEPMYDPMEIGEDGTLPDDFVTVMVDDRPAWLHQSITEGHVGEMVFGSANIVVAIDGQWFGFSGTATVPDGNEQTVEELTQRILYVLASIEVEQR